MYPLVWKLPLKNKKSNLLKGSFLDILSKLPKTTMLFEFTMILWKSNHHWKGESNLCRLSRADSPEMRSEVFLKGWWSKKTRNKSSKWVKKAENQSIWTTYYLRISEDSISCMKSNLSYPNDLFLFNFTKLAFIFVINEFM